MRILVATHNYPRWPGDPAGAFVALLARALAAEGAAVRVLAPHAAGLATEVVDAGVHVRRFRYAPARWELAAYGSTGQRAGVRRLAALASVPAFLVAYRAVAQREARAWGADIVHAHWWVPGAAAAVGWGGPTVVTCHGTDVQLLARSRAARAGARRLAPRVDRWTTVSAYLAAELAAGLGPALGPDSVAVTPMPVEVLPAVPFRVNEAGSGVPPASQSVRGASARRILYAGNLLASKGIDILVEALARLRDRGVSATLRIVGQGPARPAIEHLVRERGLAERVDWAGPLPHTAMPVEFARSAVTVLPSRAGAEGLGLVLVEALLHGCPVVGTDAGGIPETVVHERTGLLARPDDPEDLADQLERLLRDPALARRLADAGRERAYARHAPPRAAARFLALFADVLSARGGSARGGSARGGTVRADADAAMSVPARRPRRPVTDLRDGGRPGSPAVVRRRGGVGASGQGDASPAGTSIVLTRDAHD